MAATPRATKRVFGLLLLVLLILALCLWPRTKSRPAVSEPVVASSKELGTASPANPAPAKASELGLGEVFARNDRPGRLVFLRFKMDAQGVHLSGASEAAGRASAPWPGTVRPGTLVYELRDAEGSLLLQGETEDPLNRRYEYEAVAGEGHLSSRMVSYSQGELMLRLPGQLHPSSIEFFRHQDGLPENRLSLGKLSLR